MYMSFSGVFGLSSIVASLVDRRVRAANLHLDARGPFFSVTLPISPTGTPAMLTVWPWPGMTA